MRDPAEELSIIENSSLKRKLRTINSPQMREISIGKNNLLNFASNDYLGLTNHPAIKSAYIDAVGKWGAGSGSSRLLSGGLDLHRQLESYIAKCKATENAIVFANGYSTALGALSGLLEKKDTVILDKLCHASLIDGARLSGAKIRVFPHNCMKKLEKILVTTRSNSDPNSRIIVVTESVFSMDGDIALLKEIIKLKNQYGALLLLDEAHGLGIHGPKGMGLSEKLGCSSEIDLQMGTLGKSAGVAGGYLAASNNYIELLINRSRSFIYSTAPPPAQSAAALEGLKIIRSAEGSALRTKLWSNITNFAKNLNLDIPKSAIIPWHVGSSIAALNLSRELEQIHHMFIPAIRYPSVARDSARLRITITAAHSESDIHKLCNALQ